MIINMAKWWEKKYRAFAEMLERPEEVTIEPLPPWAKPSWFPKYDPVKKMFVRQIRVDLSTEELQKLSEEKKSKKS